MDSVNNSDLSTKERIAMASHAVQSGVLAEIHACGHEQAGADPKHLRTGINLCFAGHAGLADLLIKKGIITLEEYQQCQAEWYEREKRDYEIKLSAKLGREVILG